MGKACKKDLNNITYSHSVDSIYDSEGRVLCFHKEKFAPKIRKIQAVFGHRKDPCILDVGIGYGAFLKLLEDEGYTNLYGMDPFPKSIEIASAHTGGVLREGRIEDTSWPFSAGIFDVITCLDVIEHLENPALFFRHCRRYLKDKGLVVVSTPNRSIFYEMRKWPIIGIPDKQTTHINVHKPAYWTELAAQEGYIILDQWLGEHISHIRYISLILNKLSRKLYIDLRKIPGLRQMQQSFCMVLRPKETSHCEGLAQRSNGRRAKADVCMIILNEVLSDGRVMRAATALADKYDVDVMGWLRPELVDKFPTKELEKLPFAVHLVELWTARHLRKNALGYTGRYIEVLIRMLRLGRSLRPSIIHAHELNGLLIGYLLKKVTRSRLIYDAHELYREQNLWQNKFIIWAIGRLETYLMKRCDEIIACNGQRADIMYAEYGSPFLPKVIRNVPPFSEPPKSNTSLRDFVKERNPNIDRIIVHPGRFVSRGEDVVLLALAKLPKNIGLVLIGAASQTMSVEVEALIRTYDISNRVFLHPKVPYADLMCCLSSGDLGLVLYPNTNRNNYFCASNKIYEYAMCGLPLVAMDFPPCRDILEKYRYGVYFQWNNSDDLRRAIDECLSDETQYRQMQAEAFRAAREENWDKEQLRLIEIYDQLPDT